MEDVFFYTLGDESYFLGLISLINSLVLTGHLYPIIVGDCGLSSEQRDLLRGYDRVRLFPLDRSLVRNPQQFKAFPHLVHKQGTAVIIDSDMIVTDSLEPLIAKAQAGQLVTFANPVDRWFAEWKDIFQLDRVPRQQTYFCTGFQILSATHFPNLLSEWWDACRRIWLAPTHQEGADLFGSPTSQSDQDALNAVMMSTYPEHAIHLAPFDAQVHRRTLRDVRVGDAKTLRCEYHGRQPIILHASMTPKPWVRSGAARDGFDKLLRRLLTGTDVALKLPPAMVPSFLSSGASGWWARHARYLANMGLGAFVLSYMPQGVARSIRKYRMTIRSFWDRPPLVGSRA